MSKVLTQEQMQELLRNTPQEPQQGASNATPVVPRGAGRVSGICLSNRPQMAQGWLNSYEGHKWMINRCEAFSRMDTGGRMNFGFLSKNKEK